MSSDLQVWQSEFKQIAHQHYSQMRSGQPIQRVGWPTGGAAWLVTRYDDALAVLKDDRFTKDWRRLAPPEKVERAKAMPESMRMMVDHMLTTDPPEHTRLRSLVQKAFTPQFIERLRDDVQQIADDLVDRIAARAGETVDLIDTYAFPLPIRTLGRMLDIPRENWPMLRENVDEILGSLFRGDLPPEAQRRRMQAIEQVLSFLRFDFAARRASDSQDLLSAMARAEENGKGFTEYEVLSTGLLLLMGGYETTASLIGNGMMALLAHPDQLALLKARPELIKAAVEELLRFESPIEFTTIRFALEDMRLGDVAVARGEQVIVVLASANRDERQFPDTAAELDITRAKNRHLAFGHGPHYCLGAPLARLEGEIAFSTLLRRLPDIRLAAPPETLVWRPSNFIRGLETLPVHVEA